MRFYDISKVICYIVLNAVLVDELRAQLKLSTIRVYHIIYIFKTMAIEREGSKTPPRVYFIHDTCKS